MAAKEQKFIITVKDGVLKPNKDLRDTFNGLADGRYHLTIKPYRANRSTLQNAFYWHIFIQSQIDCFKEFWGETYSKQQVHDWNKANFWGEEKVIEATGEVIKTPSTSTDKTTVEWEEKLETIRQWFRQNFEWEIEYPNEQSELNF